MGKHEFETSVDLLDRLADPNGEQVAMVVVGNPDGPILTARQWANRTDASGLANHEVWAERMIPSSALPELGMEPCSECGLPTEFPLGCDRAQWYLCAACVGTQAAAKAGYVHE